MSKQGVGPAVGFLEETMRCRYTAGLAQTACAAQAGLNLKRNVFACFSCHQGTIVPGWLALSVPGKRGQGSESRQGLCPALAKSPERGAG